MPLGTPSPFATRVGRSRSERAWKIAPRVARMPRCIMPTHSPPWASTVMSLKRQPGSIVAAGPALISPEFGDGAEAIVERAGERSVGQCGQRPHRRCHRRSIRSSPLRVDAQQSPRDRIGPAHAIVQPRRRFADRGACVADQSDGAGSAMTHLVQRPEAAQTGFARVDQLAATRRPRRARSHRADRARRLPISGTTPSRTVG